jgi:hypothetical protein
MSKELKAKDIPPIIAGATIILPVLLGYNTFELGHTGWFTLSAVATAFAMYCYDRQRLLLSVTCGIMMGLGASAATLWYFEGRSHFLQIEVLIPLILGLIPGGLIYIIGKALWKVNPVQPYTSPANDHDDSPKRTDSI